MMKEPLAIATTTCVLFAIITGSQGLGNVHCSLQPTVIATKDNFYPYFVSLTRCQGSAHVFHSRNEGNHRCVAATTQMIRLSVRSMSTWRRETMKIANHTSCRSECALTASDCKGPTFLSNCECKCPYRHKECGPNKRWSQIKCRCECNVPNRNCPFTREFSERTCQCGCKQSNIENCRNMGRYFNYESCRCSKRRYSASRGNSALVASNTFWICAVLGEFVILCLIFELILYNKDHGLIYTLSKRLKTRRSPKNVVNNDNGKNGPGGRITDEEDRYVYF